MRTEFFQGEPLLVTLNGEDRDDDFELAGWLNNIIEQVGTTAAQVTGAIHTFKQPVVVDAPQPKPAIPTAYWAIPAAGIGMILLIKMLKN